MKSINQMKWTQALEYKESFTNSHCAGGFHLPETLSKIQDIALNNLDNFINGGQYKNKVN